MARGNRPGHRRFGLIRELPSGRYQAFYLGPDGRRRPAPETFPRKADAERWLSIVETELAQGEWTDPQLGKVLLRAVGEDWISEHKISRRTRGEYESLWRHHVQPYLGEFEIGQITTDRVRSWRAALLRDGRSEDRTAKAYRLLRAMMNTAVDDGRIKRNPCRVKGAGQHRTPERSTATIAQVYRLAELVPVRYRVFVLSAALTGLRWGELIALRRCDLDLAANLVQVYRRLAELRGGEMVAGPTKSAAGARAVSLPAVLVAELRRILMNSLRKGRKDSCSSGTGPARCDEGTSTGTPGGRRPWSRLAYRAAFTSTISGTRATTSPLPLARAPVS